MFLWLLNPCYTVNRISYNEVKMNIIKFFIDMTRTLWGSYSFQLFFYFSLVLIIILESNQLCKIRGFWYPVCILLIIYNPVMYFICEYIFPSKDIIAYYCRLFCLLPIAFIIAYAVTLILDKVSKWKKICCTLMILFIIAVCGHSLYSETWFTKASNYNKVPEDVLQLCNIFQGYEDPISIMVPADLVVYMRQMNSTFHMPYGRNQKVELCKQLQSETPDISFVLSFAETSKTDYIVALYSLQAQVEYLNQRCEVVGYTDKYMVLKHFY